MTVSPNDRHRLCQSCNSLRKRRPYIIQQLTRPPSPPPPPLSHLFTSADVSRKQQPSTPPSETPTNEEEKETQSKQTRGVKRKYEEK